MPPRRRRDSVAPLSRERALRTALTLADADGIDALTMRHLADALGVEAMSLYHHVRNKDDILDGMVDLVFAEIELPGPDEPWREGLVRRARSMRTVLLRHPWAGRLLESRARPGPMNLAHHDAMLGVLRRGGFPIVLAGHAYALLDAFVYGFVHVELTLPFRSTEETHALAAEIFGAVPPGELPHLMELTRERVLQPGYAYADEFEWGLAFVLEGLERARG